MGSIGNGYDGWPELPFPAFAGTARLLHAGCQMLGKLRLAAPAEPHGGHLVLPVTSRGVSSGPVAAGPGTVTAELDLIDHRCRVGTTWGTAAAFPLGSCSVADLYHRLLDAIAAAGVWPAIDPAPVGAPDALPFDEDDGAVGYDAGLASAWWRAMVSAWRVLARHHAGYRGVTPPVGLAWDTLDLREVRLFTPAAAQPAAAGPDSDRTAPGSDRTAPDRAMDRAGGGAAAIECGFWPGSPTHPRPLFYSFSRPEPAGVATVPVEIGSWDGVLREFVLDYDEVRAGADPAGMLLGFLETTYRVQATLAGWPAGLARCARPEPADEPAGPALTW